MSEKAKCIIAYVFGWIGGLIILLTEKNGQRNTKFHAAQSIVIGGGYSAISLVYGIINISMPVISVILSGLYIVLIVLGIVRACDETQDPEIPVVGELTKSIFGNMIDGN